MILFIFGDSITHGYWDEAGGWADRIKRAMFIKDISNKFASYDAVYNLGIDGNTTQQVIERFDREVAARTYPGADYAVLFAIGTNDTIQAEDGETYLSTEEYTAQLKLLTQKAHRITDSIAYVTLAPVDENLTNPLPASTTGKCYTNERIKLFNEALTKFCSESNTSCIDVFSDLSARNDVLADGLHPNTNGHELIYNTLLPTIESWLYPSI